MSPTPSDGQGTPVTQTTRGQAVLLPYTGSPDSLELWCWTLAAHQHHHNDVHALGTKELMHVLEGQITLVIGSEVVILEAGDAIAFDGDVPHALTDTGDEGATFTHAVYEPDGAWSRP